MSGFQQRLESLGARALLGLPESLLRPLAGSPVEKDGQTQGFPGERRRQPVPLRLPRIGRVWHKDQPDGEGPVAVLQSPSQLKDHGRTGNRFEGSAGLWRSRGRLSAAGGG